MISYDDIFIEINGLLYTTKKDFDHSVICEILTMDDLVELKVLSKMRSKVEVVENE